MNAPAKKPPASDTSLPTTTQAKGGLVAKFAARFGVEPNKMMSTLKATAFRIKDREATNEEMMGLLVVADQHGLNPFTREIFAFPDKQNGVVPVVSVDGWLRIINSQEELDGIAFRYSEEVVQVGDDRFPGLKHPAHEWIECSIKRKDRAEPITAREYLDEVYRPPFQPRGKDYAVESAWQTHTRRFHRHKALIQCARIAFGFAGIYDEDEAERIREAGDRVVIDVESREPSVPAPKAIGAPAPETDDEPEAPEETGAKRIGKGVIATLRNHLKQKEIPEDEFCHHFEVDSIDHLTQDRVARATEWILGYGD